MKKLLVGSLLLFQLVFLATVFADLGGAMQEAGEIQTTSAGADELSIKKQEAADAKAARVEAEAEREKVHADPDSTESEKLSADKSLAEAKEAEATAEKEVLVLDPNAVEEEINEVDEKLSEASEELQEIRRNELYLLDPEVDLEALINKSATFKVSEHLSVGNEGSLELSAEDTEQNILYRVIDLMIKTLGTVVVLLYVVGGFFIITSQGDENQLQKGKTIVTYTSLGLVIALSSYIIISVVMSAAFNIGD